MVAKAGGVKDGKRGRVKGGKRKRVMVGRGEGLRMGKVGVLWWVEGEGYYG